MVYYKPDIVQLHNSAEQGNADAQFDLGKCYAQGEHVPQNHNEAAKWYRKAAEQGHKSAQTELGKMYQTGEGVQKSDAEAVKWLHKSSIQGDAAAQVQLGLMYQYGQGVSQSDSEAIKWYQKSAELGNPDAQRLLQEIQQKYDKCSDQTESVFTAMTNNKELELYRKKAEQGDADAQYQLGNVFFVGEGVEEDNDEAIKWFRKAAAQGHADAQYQLGEIYYWGQGVDEDYNEAIDWYFMAAEQGHADAQYTLGNMYYSGERLDVDYDEAAIWYRKAAKQGHADAQFQLGEMYYHGWGVNEDFEKAEYWYRKAAEQGHKEAQNNLDLMHLDGKIGSGDNVWDDNDELNDDIPPEDFELEAENNKDEPEKIRQYRRDAIKGDATAQFNLGVMYANGEGVPQDYNEALKWYRKSAEQDNAGAYNNIGTMYYSGKGVPQSYDEAVKCFRKAAELGDANGHNNMGLMYEGGLGVRKNDDKAANYYCEAVEKGLATALNYLTKLGDKGNSVAQFNLAWIYRNGKGVPQNDAEAVKWYRKAAEQGHVVAQNNLGVMLQNGQGISRDDKEAVKWFHKAADQGYALAQYNLGIMYRDGLGVPQNNTESLKWYHKAAEQGHEDAQKYLDRLKAKGTDIDKDGNKAVSDKSTASTTFDSESEKPKKVSDCKSLLDACTPRLYKQNIFRISGIRIDATPREIKRRFDDLKTAAEMGDLKDELSHAFALNPVPNVDQIREAAQRFQDPEKRIIDEFFWFWPLDWDNSDNDFALEALNNGNSEKALTIWSDSLSDNNMTLSTIAKHNLAVLHHLKAIDSEFAALEHDLSAEALNFISKDWHTCFKWWEDLVDDDDLWSLVNNRIRTIDDPRLTTGFSRRLRSSLPEAMDKINALFAVSFAEKGKLSQATKHIEYMKETHQGKDDVAKTLSIIMDPLKKRVDNAVERATSTAKKNPNKADKAAFELLQSVSETMKIIRTILPSDDHKRMDLCDHVAEACLSCQVAYARETDDFNTFLKILDEALKYAASKETKDNIAEERSKIVINTHISSLRKKIEEIENSKLSIANKMNFINNDLLPSLSKIKNTTGLSADLYEKCADYVASYLRSLAITEYNEHGNLKGALAITELAISVAKGTEERERLREDKDKLMSFQNEAVKHNLYMTIRSDEIEVTREFVRYNSQKIAVSEIQGIKYGIYIVKNQYGMQTSTSYLIEVTDDLLSIGVPSNALLQQCIGGLTGSRRIKIECNRFFRKEAQVSEDFNKILDALFHQVVPDLVEKLAKNIVSGTALEVGDCRLTNRGMYITTGRLVWKKETLVFFSDLNFSRYGGYVTVSSVKDSKINASLSIRDVWNAALLEFITKVVMEMKT